MYVYFGVVLVHTTTSLLLLTEIEIVKRGIQKNRKHLLQYKIEKTKKL